MGKYGKKMEINLDPLHYNIGLLGESGIGKSTIMKDICEKLAGNEGYIALDIGKEDGHDAINGIVSEKIEDWEKFVDVTDDIIENKDTDYPNLRVVIIDTYDELCNLAEKEVIRLHNKKNPDKKTDTINAAFGGFGKGMDKAVELMLDRLWELKKVGVSFILICHVKKKDIDDVMTEEQYSVLTSNTTQKYFNAIKTKLHFLGLAYIDRDIVKQKTGKKDIKGKEIEKGKIVGESRVINFRDDTYSVDSKSRFADIVDKIPFDADAFIKAMKDAILAEHNKGSKSVAESEKEQAAEAKEANKKANEYAKAKRENKANIERNNELVSVIQDKFGESSDEVKSEIKSIMTEFGFSTFKNPEEIPTKALEKIVKLLND